MDNNKPKCPACGSDLELEILLNKQDKIIKEIDKLHPVHDYKKYKELSESYNRYSMKTDKLMGL